MGYSKPEQTRQIKDVEITGSKKRYQILFNQGSLAARISIDLKDSKKVCVRSLRSGFKPEATGRLDHSRLSGLSRPFFSGYFSKYVKVKRIEREEAYAALTFSVSFAIKV